MSLECVVNQPIQITITYEYSAMVDVSMYSPFIDHFLRTVSMNRSVYTWINYAHDLKVFFSHRSTWNHRSMIFRSRVDKVF